MTSVLDKAFQIIFARSRRKNPSLDWAFKDASNKFHAYLMWAILAFVVPPVTVILSHMRAELAFGERTSGIIVGVIVLVAVDRMLDNRFKKFMVMPPPLSPAETREEWWYIFWFRVLSLSLLIPVALIGFFIRRT